MKKVWIGGLIIAVIASSALFFKFAQHPSVAPAKTLFPRDTIYYYGTQSPLKIKAALAFIDLKKILKDSAGLTEAESQIVSEWVGGLQGVHVGFRSFTLVPMVLDAAIVLEGSFSRPVTDLFSPALQQRLSKEESYRAVEVQKLLIDIKPKFSLELYITKPLKNRILIAFSKRSLTETIDRMLDGGPSLADNPSFKSMTALKGVRNAGVLEYADNQAILRLLNDWAKSAPQPQFKALADLVWKEFRLTDYGSSASGGPINGGPSCSFFCIDPTNPLYLQQQYKKQLILPFVPTNSQEFVFCRLAEPAQAVRQLIDMSGRLAEGFNAACGKDVTQPLENFLGQISIATGGKPAEVGTLLNGDLGMWRSVSADQTIKKTFCFYIGINDAARVKEVIGKIPDLKISETNGIYTIAGRNKFVWSVHVQADRLLISSDLDYLKDSLSLKGVSLTETPAFRELLKDLPKKYSVLHYKTYEHGVSFPNTGRFSKLLSSVSDVLKGYREMSVACAADGMLTSHQSNRFNVDPKAIQTMLGLLFSTKFAPEEPVGPPRLSITADEAYKQSIALLSDGRQIDAEELIDRAVRQYSGDIQLLFAKAVLERSRWSNDTAHWFFSRIMQLYPDNDLSKASKLAIVLDDHQSAQSNIEKLIQLSDAHPNDIYLLWLSAIECREQKLGEQAQVQYEKLLKHFRVGPVMVHHTYANVLAEQLKIKNYEEALKHRNIAVSLEARGSTTLQGLANTLTDMGRYEQASAVWARAVQLAPDDADDWVGWGRTLYYLKRYDDAVSKCLEATRLNAGNGYNWYWAGKCYEELKQYGEMVKCFQKAVDLNYNEALEQLGWCYQFGNGVEKDGYKAFELYSQSAQKTDSAYSNYRLGECYSFGIGVKADKKKAAFYYREAIQRNPMYGEALNNLAWLLATAGDQSLRDYPEAVRLAERAVAAEELYSHLDTLAVAYAANGQYEQAAQAQKRLIAFCQKAKTKEETITRLTARLANYEKEAAKQPVDTAAH